MTHLSNPNLLDKEAICAKLYEGLATVDDFADAVERSRRTVEVWIKQGLPVTYIGRRPFVVVDPGAEWLRSRRSPQMQRLASQVPQGLSSAA